VHYRRFHPVMVSCFAVAIPGGKLCKLSAMLFYSLLRLLLYTIYLKLLGWGKNRREQPAYIIACIPVMLIFLKNIKARMILT
jgi:hypothetical protein